MSSETISLHVDGSMVRVYEKERGRYRHFLGWGVVAAFRGLELEQHGSLEVDKALDGCHELAAFVEGALLASSRGFVPEQTAFWTDDEVVGHAPTYLHCGNGHGLRAESLSTRLRTLTNKLYTPAVFELAMTYLAHSRVHKVRGHSFLVCHERADYLARHSANAARKGLPARPMAYAGWLAEGFRYFERGAAKASVWHPPFTATQL